MPDYEFVPFVLTNHAKERMQLRDITTQMIAEALANPHSTQDAREGDTKYIRFFNRRELHVIAFYKANQKKWIVKSTWIRGENDSLLLDLYQSFTRWLSRFFKS
jgi:hypothetical protein